MQKTILLLLLLFLPGYGQAGQRHRLDRASRVLHTGSINREALVEDRRS